VSSRGAVKTPINAQNGLHRNVRFWRAILLQKSKSNNAKNLAKVDF